MGFDVLHLRGRQHAHKYDHRRIYADDSHHSSHHQEGHIDEEKQQAHEEATTVEVFAADAAVKGKDTTEQSDISRRSFGPSCHWNNTATAAVRISTVACTEIEQLEEFVEEDDIL